MKNDKEIVGTLLGFDDFVNMVLEDVMEFETTPEGRRVTKLDQILLNGNNITMVWNANISFYFQNNNMILTFSLSLAEKDRKLNHNFLADNNTLFSIRGRLATLKFPQNTVFRRSLDSNTYRKAQLVSLLCSSYFLVIWDVDF